MTDEFVCALIAVAILAMLALWVPALHLCNAGCQKALRRMRERRDLVVVPIAVVVAE